MRFVPVLMYHNIVEKEIPTAPDWITVALFEEQLAYLQQNGYTFITPYLLLTPHLLPKKPVLITFDDGYENVYNLAFPVLKKFNAHFSLFLIANFLSSSTCTKNNTWDASKRPMAKHLSNTMIEEMLQSNLVTLGGHSFSHKPFHLLSQTEIDEELSKSKQHLENLFNQPITSFSYPGCYIGIEKTTCQLLKKNGFELAFGGQKNSLVDVKKINYFNINRINIENDVNFSNSRAKLRFEVIIHPFLSKLSVFNKLNFLIRFLLPFYK